MTNRLNIFDFTNYRAFMSASFDESRKRNPRWSYQAWAKHLNLKNSTSLLKIIRGEREAGPTISKKLSSYFKFKSKEYVYFYDLVHLSKAKNDPSLSVAIMQKIQSQFPNQKYRFLDEKEFSAISHWWFYAIRQIIKCHKSVSDPHFIAKQLCFKVSVKDIREAIKIMCDLKLIKRNKIGHLECTNEALQTTDDIASEAIKNFHEEMITNAKEAVRSVPVMEREISACTLPIAKKDITKVKAYIKHVKDEFLRLFECCDEAEVYQLNIQFFPLTKFKSTRRTNGHV